VHRKEASNCRADQALDNAKSTCRLNAPHSCRLKSVQPPLHAKGRNRRLDDSSALAELGLVDHQRRSEPAPGLCASQNFGSCWHARVIHSHTQALESQDMPGLSTTASHVATRDSRHDPTINGLACLLELHAIPRTLVSRKNVQPYSKPTLTLATAVAYSDRLTLQRLFWLPDAVEGMATEM
jgi:hypothetical protein